MKVIALSWAPFGHRMDELSRAVGGVRVSITLLYGPRYFAPLRYLALFIRTLLLLAVESPDVVYAQNPPVFCPLACLLYCRAAGRVLVIDHHSVWRLKTIGGVLGRGIGFLEALVASSAGLNSSPHAVWAKKLRAMGASKVMVVHDFVEKNPFAPDRKFRDRYAATPFLVIASHGGHPLEGVEAEVAAASRVDGLTLLVTGPPNKLAGRLKNLPANVKYLGLLPMEDYLRLKASCDLALNITDEPFTLSHVIFEYISSGLPVVSSRQQVVEEAFGDSLAYVRSSSRADVESVLKDLIGNPARLAELRRKSGSKFQSLQSQSEAELDRLRDWMRVAARAAA